MSFIEIFTPRLRVRDHYISDLATHHSLLSHSVAMNYLDDIRTSTLEESEDNLMLAINAIQEPKRIFYFLRIEDLATEEHIGEIGYDVNEYGSHGNTVHLGYFSYPKFWNKGYVTESVLALMEFAFMSNNVARINTGCLEENIGSRRVMEKCGMMRNKHNDRLETHNNEQKQYIAYSLSKEQWLKNKISLTNKPDK